jgi:hypothetical protein
MLHRQAVALAVHLLAHIAQGLHGLQEAVDRGLGHGQPHRQFGDADFVALRQRLQDGKDLQHRRHRFRLPGVVCVVFHRFDFFGLAFHRIVLASGRGFQSTALPGRPASGAAAHRSAVSAAGIPAARTASGDQPTSRSNGSPGWTLRSVASRSTGWPLSSEPLSASAAPAPPAQQAGSRQRGGVSHTLFCATMRELQAHADAVAVRA